MVVTGGGRGLRLGTVGAIVGQGAKDKVTARDAGALEAVRAQLGAETVSADITDAATAKRIAASEPVSPPPRLQFEVVNYLRLIQVTL